MRKADALARGATKFATNGSAKRRTGEQTLRTAGMGGLLPSPAVGRLARPKRSSGAAELVIIADDQK